jgi:hypothetical protein
MYTLVIKDKEYKLPEDLTLDQWIEVTKFDIGLEFNHKKIVSLCFDIPYDEVDIIPDKTIQLLISFIYVMLYPEHQPLKKDYMGGEYINLNGLTLGKFIDMEIYLSDGLNKSIKPIIKTLWGIEPTDEFMISGVWTGIQNFISYRNSLYKNYTNLFGGEGDGYAEVETKQTTQDIKKIWYDIILTLAEGKFLFIDDVTDKSLVSAFNWLAWNKDKMEKQKEEIKKNDLQRNNRRI